MDEGYEGLDNEIKTHVTKMFEVELGIIPRPIQTLGIFLMAFMHLTTLLVSGTGTGKTAIMHGTALLLRGITLVIVPLTGLGSQQKDRANNTCNKIKSFHLDTIKDLDRQEKVRQYCQKNHTTKSIILFVSPQTLDKRFWHRFIKECIHQGRITSVFVDEAHAVVMAGRTFRNEFLRLWANLFATLSHWVPIMCMTATMTQTIFDDLKKILRLDFDEIIWYDSTLQRRDIELVLRYKSATLATLKSCVTRHLKVDDRHVMIYCNKVTRATGAVRQSMLDLLEKNNMASIDVLCFNGQCGDFEKNYFIEIVTLNHDTHPLATSMNHLYMFQYNPRVLLLTDAGEMGIDDRHCGFVGHDGLPPNMFVYSQRNGRSGRVDLPPNCDVEYESTMVVTLASFCNLAIRNQRAETPVARAFQKERLQEMLQFATLQDGCLYSKLEDFFGNPEERQRREALVAKNKKKRGRCKRGRRHKKSSKKQKENEGEEETMIGNTCGGQNNGKCSYCFPKAGEECLVVNVASVVRELRHVAFRETNSRSPFAVAEVLWENKHSIFIDPKRRIFKADVQLIVLQLIAGEILSYCVSTVTLKKKVILSVQVSPILLVLGHGGSTMAAYEDEQRWKGIGVYNVTAR